MPRRIVPTEFTVYPTAADRCPDPEIRHWVIKVEYRSGRGTDALYAVTWMGSVLTSGTFWESEPLPSNRTPEFLATARYPLSRARDLALTLVDSLTHRGRTLEEWLAHWDAKDKEGSDGDRV